MKNKTNNRQKKPQREKRSVHQFKHRAGFTDEHHLKPRERGGQTVSSNLLSLDAYRHDAWHLLFGNKTLDEVIDVLEKTKHLKEKQRFRVLIN